ncbi:MAG: hypothetical protein OEY90_05935 [Candidatus Bathyarchaeota archaeon]|nr:hypothetical protein [Candidatus Bathyarchaeota archaeon]
MRTSPSTAVTKLQVLLVIDLIVVAFAAGGYYHIQTLYKPTPEPAAFSVYGLKISPDESWVGEAITISVQVSNVGEEAGSYSVNLIINDVFRKAETIQLSGGENTTVEFTVIEASEGSYSVKIGSLTGTYRITATAPPSEPAAFSVYGLKISPDESWVGEAITISVQVSNPGDTAVSGSLDLIINGEVRESKDVWIPGGKVGTVKFTVTEDSLGKYIVEVRGNKGTFEIVPAGKHTLSIRASGPVEFTINGKKHETPYSALLDVGTYTVEMPMTDPTGEYVFLHWEDYSKNPTRTIRLTSRVEVFAYFSGGSSCPSLYIWNGTSYVYVSEVSNHGWLGYINYINEDGSIVFWRNDPWDYLKLDKNQLQPRNGYYDLILTQRWDETFYLDAAYMLIVDHPSNVSVYSTGVEQYIDPNFMGQIYTVSKHPLTPISAVNEKGEDVLPQISKVDGIFTPGINGLNSPSWDNITWNRLTLNLGDLSNAEQTKLVVRGKVDWGSASDYNTWIDSFFAQPVPNGTQITPPPYMEVKDANGNWIRVPESRQFPIPPDVNPRTWVVDLTDLFPTNDYSLRINNFWNVTFDYIGVDTTSQTNVIIQRIDPQASLYQVFTTYSKSEGNFTRYGDVTQLVLDADDKFVIGRQGDEVSFKFPAIDIAPLPENMERDIFLFVSCWFKDEYGNWGFGFGFTVDPLPFQDMSGFPYPPTESYPYDTHLSYLLEYNTRIITIP